MFNQYPYLNLNDLNLDYILNAMREMKYEVTNFVSINAIKYADPIQWNITSQYEKNTVVIDPLTGTAYISVAPVPSGVALTRPEYWSVVFDLGSFVTRAAQNFTSRWEADTTLTATFPTNTGEWLVWGDILYKALTNIVAGDQYVVGSNIEHFTIEDLYNTYLNTIASILAMIGDLQELTTSDTSDIVHAINSVLDDLNITIGDLADLTTSDASDIVHAINSVLDDLNLTIGDLANLSTSDKSSVVNAINENVSNIANLNAKKLDFVIGDISIVRYDYGYYTIDVLKLSHTNQDGTINKPFCKGEYNLDGMEIFAEGTKLAVNGGFYDSAYKMQGNTISNGSVITGNVISSPDVCYLGVDGDGDFKYYDQNTPMGDILADGCNNAMLAWCPLIENHAMSANILSLSQTSQQNVGIDDDLNYYIITTSYYCPLDIQNVATWILSNYPEIKTAFAIDSGGSAQTRVYNIMTNVNSDLNRQYGRQIPSALCFPITNTKNDITTILDVMKITKENTMPQVVYNSGMHTQIGTKIQMSYFNSYQIGNLFFGSGQIETEVGYDGSWTRLTTLENYLPSPDRHSYFPIISFYSANNSGRVDINPSSDEMDIKPTIEVKAPANNLGQSQLYDVTFIYAVKQMR